MSSPSSPALRELHRLDKSSPGFGNQLNDIISGEKYAQCERNLERDDSVWLINYLDEALSRLDPSSPASRKCLRELGKICGAKGILPTSHHLPPQLLEINSTPFTPGGSYDVYEGNFKGSKVRVKRIPIDLKDVEKTAAKDFCKEAATWKYLKHPNVLPLLGVTITPLQLISNWASGGHLPKYIKDHPEADRLGLLREVAEGLRYLHSCHVVHGDLKGANILVESSGHVRIADFGLAKITGNSGSIRNASVQNGFTMQLVAPEVWNQGEYSEKADIFSFSMVMIEVFTGAVPFGDLPSVRAMVAINQGERPPRPKHPYVTGSLWRLIRRCWDQLPSSRPETSEVAKVLNSNPPTWKQLIVPTLSEGNRASLMASIFDCDELEPFEYLSGNDAQAFVDVIDEALQKSQSPPLEIRRRSLCSLCVICGREALLPKSVPTQINCNPTEAPLGGGGSADVWKGKQNNKIVAAKALRIYSTSDRKAVRRRFCKEVMIWSTLRHPNVLRLVGVTMMGERSVMVSEWMDNGDIIQFLRKKKDANRLQLLAGAARGLTYMHHHGIVHGNLRPPNILVNGSGHAVLAGFSQATPVLGQDESPFLSSWIPGSMVQWMSPELLDREGSSSLNCQPTMESDCYALGMAIYEILSGSIPFGPNNSIAVLYGVLDGERPKRPKGEAGKLLTNDVWDVVERCWKAEPSKRASAEDMLRCLEGRSPAVGRSGG